MATLMCKFTLIVFSYEGEWLALRKKCPYSELFWYAFSRIQT